MFIQHHSARNHLLDFFLPETDQELVSWSVFFLPILLILYAPIAEVVVAILAMGGCWQLLCGKAQFSRSLVMLSGAFLLFYLTMILSVAFSDNQKEGIEELGSNIHFLLAPFFLLAIDQRVSFISIMKGIRIAIVVGVIFAFFQFFIMGIDRAEAGSTAPTIFGFLMFVFSMAHWILSMDELSMTPPSKKSMNTGRILTFSLFFMGVFSALLSQTRNIWLLMFFLPILLLMLPIIRARFGMRWLSYAYLIIFTAFVCFFLTGDFLDRFLLTINNIKENIMQQGSSTSIGQRMAMWQGGISSLRELPVFGYGIQQTNVVAAQYLPYNHEAFEKVKNHQQLHNDYLNTLVGMGIPGLVAFFGLLLWPLRYCFKSLSVLTKETSNICVSRFLVPIVFILSMSMFALTDSLYSSAVMRTFWVALLGALLLSTSNFSQHFNQSESLAD